MSNLLSLSQAAARLGVHKDTIRKQILAGTCPYPSERDAEGRWFICLTAQNIPQNGCRMGAERTQDTLTDAPQATYSAPVAEEGNAADLTEYDRLIDELRAEHAETLRQLREAQAALERICRNVSGLNAAVNDFAELPGRVAELEAGQRWLESQRKIPETAVYRQVEERQATEVYEAGRAARTGFLARLGRGLAG